jgi:site-specific DNA-methyltransferase (adenine-specific)
VLTVHHGDNLAVLPALPAATFDLVYIDPPFNTGRKVARRRMQVQRAADGDRVGFHGQRWRTLPVASSSFADQFDDYLAFLAPRLLQVRRLLAPTGSFFLHLDCREVHYAKVLCDQIFGRASFQNEIVWAYDYGARSRSRWPQKHDTILWYTADPKRYTFRYRDQDRVPYMAPKLVGAEKAAVGKTPTDVWWHTIVSPTGKEKTGYPTQKPLGVLERIVRVHSNPGDRLLDCFAGSGTLGEAAAKLGRDCVLVDQSRAAILVMQKRLAAYGAVFVPAARGSRR